MNIFITGGTGFIGTHVVNLLKKKHKLLVLSRKNVSDVQTVIGDLSHISTWRKKLENFKPDICIHLAWEGIPDYGKEMSKKNLDYGINLYKIIADIGCKKIITTGSCWEYMEENFFSKAKKALYKKGLKIAANNKISFIWLRLFYVYGPGQKQTSLIPYLISNKNPELKNPDGANDFIYVQDVAKAIKKICETNISTNTFDIGSGKLTSVKYILSIIQNKKDTNKIKQTQITADTIKIKRITGWMPTTPIEKGIKKITTLLP